MQQTHALSNKQCKAAEPETLTALRVRNDFLDTSGRKAHGFCMTLLRSYIRAKGSRILQIHACGTVLSCTLVLSALTRGRTLRHTAAPQVAAQAVTDGGQWCSLRERHVFGKLTSARKQQFLTCCACGNCKKQAAEPRTDTVTVGRPNYSA